MDGQFWVSFQHQVLLDASIFPHFAVELGGASFCGFLLVAIDPLSGSRIGKWIKARGEYEIAGNCLP